MRAKSSTPGLVMGRLVGRLGVGPGRAGQSFFENSRPGAARPGSLHFQSTRPYPSRPVKFSSDGLRPGPASQRFQRMGHGPDQPIIVSNFHGSAQPGPLKFQMFRPDQAWPMILAARPMRHGLWKGSAHLFSATARGFEAGPRVGLFVVPY